MAEPGDAQTTAPSFALPGFLSVPDSPSIDGRYELTGPLGRGGTAIVYRAHDRELGRDVALKLFEAPADDVRQVHEIDILRRLRHPGLVGVEDYGTDGGRTYLVMPLVEGESLAERLRQGPLPPEEVLHLATRLAGTLAYVHGEGVNHRDLKPANVLLAADGPMISDFGIARAFGSTRVTRTGEVIGTAAYMAPEQVAGEQVGFPADVYALGLVLLECLTGRCEYPGTALESAVARLHRAPVVPAGLPAGLTAMLTRMTARDPLARPTAGEVVAALEEGAFTAEPVPHRRNLHRVAAACGVLGIAGALATALLADQGVPADTAPLPPPVTYAPPITGVPSLVPGPGETRIVTVTRGPVAGDPGERMSTTTLPPASVVPTVEPSATDTTTSEAPGNPDKTKHTKPKPTK